jgi:hypothetical protein
MRNDFANLIRNVKFRIIRLEAKLGVHEESCQHEDDYNDQSRPDTNSNVYDTRALLGPSR